jgi:hypothetical protein
MLVIRQGDGLELPYQAVMIRQSARHGTDFSFRTIKTLTGGIDP